MTSGVQTPLSSFTKALDEPLKTFRSTWLLGTPYLLAIPQDEYCQICQFAVQSAFAQAWA